MCDYCDCRSHAEIAALSAEHDVLQQLLADLRAATHTGNPVRRGDAAQALATALLPHAAREEQGVFAQLRQQVDAAYVARFTDDHALLHGLIALAGESTAAAEELHRLLHAHIAREESDLFPAAHQVLTPDQWSALAPGEGP